MESKYYKEDLNMIMNPLSWGMYPALPMKKRVKSDMPIVGFILADNIKKLYIGNFLELSIDKKPLSEFKTKEYKTVEAILKDGWEID